jgi:hypothetical protein
MEERLEAERREDRRQNQMMMMMMMARIMAGAGGLGGNTMAMDMSNIAENYGQDLEKMNRLGIEFNKKRCIPRKRFGFGICLFDELVNCRSDECFLTANFVSEG